MMDGFGGTKLVSKEYLESVGFEEFCKGSWGVSFEHKTDPSYDFELLWRPNTVICGVKQAEYSIVQSGHDQPITEEEMVYLIEVIRHYKSNTKV